MISAILWCVAIGRIRVLVQLFSTLLLLFTAGVLNLTFSSMGQTIVQMLSRRHLRGPADRLSLWQYGAEALVL